MKFKKSLQLSITLLIAASSMVTAASAQEKSSSTDAAKAAVKDHAACFESDIKIVDDLPKRPTKKSEQQIIDKIIHFTTCNP